MRGVLLTVAVALGLASAASAVEPVAVPLPEGAFGGALDAGALFYHDYRRGRSTVQRFDLATRERILLYAPRTRRAAIVRLEAGGGVVAIEVIRGLERRRVLALDPRRGAPVLIATSHLRRRDGCGSDLRLEDVSDAGEIVVSRAVVPCGGGTGRFAVRAYRQTGPPLVLERHPTNLVLIGDGFPYRAFQGTHLLTWGSEVARVRDVATGRARRLVVPGPRWGFGEADVDADGRVLLEAFRVRRGRPQQRLLLDGSIVFDSGRPGPGFAVSRFCGRQAVLHVAGVRRERLTLVDPPQLLRAGPPLAIDFVTACDPDQYVLIDGNRPRALVYDLPA